MTTENLSENVDSDLKEHDPGYNIYLIAGRMDVQSLLLAKKLHELGYIYALYGALDGLSLSYSMFKLLFDLQCSTSDEMLDWMLTDTGIVTAASTSITLIVFSMLANYFDDEEDKNTFKDYIATAWPYFRDTMKALKNGYKGVRFTVQALEVLSGMDLNHLIVPVGLLLGGLSVANRLWSRRMVEERKEMMKANAELLKQIKESEELNFGQLEILYRTMKGQSELLKNMALLSAGYAGAVDGLYLYIGALSLCPLAFPAFIVMAVFCAIYFLTYIAARIFEEYAYQQKLSISRAEVDLAYTGRKMELLFTELQTLTIKLSLDPMNETLLEERKNLLNEFELEVSAFKAKREELSSLSTLSHTSAFLAGLKDGLVAYGALASILVAVSTVLILASYSFPPALLITGISFGMVLLIGFISHFMITNYQYRVNQTQKLEEDAPQSELLRIEQLLKENKKDVMGLKPEEVKTTISKGMKVDSLSQFPFQKWFEEIRAFFSGLVKGSKAVDYTMNPLHEVDEQGYYHDTPIMLGVMIFSSITHAFVFALRAHARGFGRPPIDGVKSDVEEKKCESGQDESLNTTSNDQKPPSDEKENTPAHELSTKISTKPSSVEESGQNERQPGSPKFSRSNVGFFSKKDEEKPRLPPHSYSPPTSRKESIPYPHFYPSIPISRSSDDLGEKNKPLSFIPAGDDITVGLM